MVIVTAVYPERAGGRFDLDYYLNRHAPFASALLGPAGLVGLRVVKPLPGADGAAAPFRIVSEMTFTSAEAFQKAMTRHGAELLADMANYTDLDVILQVGELSLDWRANG